MGLTSSGALLALTALGCQRTSAAPVGGPPPVPVQIDQVRLARLRDTSEYVATLRSRRAVEVQPQVEGHLTRIFVTSGTRVRRGATLMQIDPSRQRAEVQSQEAGRRAKRANLAYWRTQAARVQRLYAGGGASRQEVDQALASLRSAEADLHASAAQVEAEDVQLRYYRVTAPASGILGDIPVRVGDYVTTSTLLTTLDQNAVLEAYVEVPLERAASAHVGLPAELVDATGKTLAQSRITFVSPRASTDTQTILVKVVVENRDDLLRSAQFVRARLIWREYDGPVVPVLAVQSRNGQNFAWVVRDGPGGTLLVDQRVVQVGPIQGQSYPVLKGLEPGERVVVSGVQKLRPGAKVTNQPGAGS